MTIQYQNRYLSVSLPADWDDASEQDVIAFASISRGEELTLGVHTFVRPLAREELSGVVWSLLQRRAESCGQISAGAFQILEAAQPLAEAAEVNASFAGIDSRNSVYCQAQVVGRKAFAVSITYYQHRCVGAGPSVMERAALAISMVKVVADA